MAYNIPRPQIVIQGPVIDLTTVANHNIFTTHGVFIVTAIVFNAVSMTGNIGLPGISLGWTASNYDDIVSNDLNAPTATPSTFNYTITSSNTPPIPTSTTLVVRVATADVTATTNTQTIYIHGFYA